MTTLVSDYWRATRSASEKREDGYRLIADLYREGLSFEAIRERLGVSKSMIDRALTVHHVERRPRAKPKGVPNRKIMVVRKRNAQRIAKRRVDCVRCGLMLAEAPGIVEGLCSLCCEDVARGVVYAGEDREGFIRWGEMVVRVKGGK